MWKFSRQLQVHRVLGALGVWLVLSTAFLAKIATAQQLQESSGTAESSSANLVQSLAKAATAMTVTQDVGDIRYGIFKSDQDARRYRYLVLGNNMRVLLISDAKTEKSSAALSVRVGSYDNPSDREGLAHFLEHMLFLGTEKYPAADEYQKFIATHGGSHNAYTSLETTTYFFDVMNEQFQGALDRFSQFFIAPLFNETYVNRERQAVHAEFTAKLKDDGRREWEVLREVANPAHPIAKFSVGNLQTLADLPDRNVRDELIEFYKKHYSADQMTAVILGRENIDVLTQWARHFFGAIPLKDNEKEEVVAVKAYAPLISPKALPSVIEIQPAQELRKISFNFPISYDENVEAHKTYDYLAHLLGHEGSGSLIAFLKRLGWAESVTAGINFKSRHDAFFTISFDLTPAGFNAREQLHSLLFYQIEQVRNKGIASWRYQELQDVAEAKFRFHEQKKPIDTVVHLVEKLFWYQPSQILRNDLWFAGLNERQVRAALNQLTPQNLLITVVAPEVKPFRLSERYQAPYAVRHQSIEVFDIKPAIKQELQLPERNVFIPKRLDIKSLSLLDRASSDAIPELIYRDRDAQVWFASGREFNQPKASIHINFKLPMVAQSAQGAAYAQLLAALVRDELVSSSYPAQLAGIDYELNATQRGFEVVLHGFSSRQNLLLNRIVEVLAKPSIRSERFEIKRTELIRELRNRDKVMPFQYLLAQLDVLQASPSWSDAQLITALETLDFNRFSRFAGNVFIDGKMDMLIFGNYFRQEALKLSVMVDHHLLGRQTGRAMPVKLLHGVGGAQERPQLYVHTTDHSDTFTMLWVSAEATDVSAVAHMRLLQQLMKSSFYHKLRTEKQLGYVVAAVLRPVQQLEGIGFLIQSPNATPSALVKEINQYLDEAQSDFLDDLESNKRALVSRLREPAQSMSDQASRFWESIKFEDWSFNRRERIASAVEMTTQESLKTFYGHRILSPMSQLWLLNKPLDAPLQWDAVDDIGAYKRTRRSFPYQ